MSFSIATKIIKPKFSLAKLTKEDEIIGIIVTLVNKVTNVITDPKMLDLLSYIANLVENLVKDKYQIDKKNILVKIYKLVFPDITDEDIAAILENLQHLYDAGEIKKISTSAILCYYSANFFQKKVHELE